MRDTRTLTPGALLWLCAAAIALLVLMFALDFASVDWRAAFR